MIDLISPADFTWSADLAKKLIWWISWFFKNRKNGFFLISNLFLKFYDTLLPKPNYCQLIFQNYISLSWAEVLSINPLTGFYLNELIWGKWLIVQTRTLVHLQEFGLYNQQHIHTYIHTYIVSQTRT